MIEYALIVVLVILGIVIMGPYVLRSINAHFKLWDGGVQDSFTEKIKQSSFIPNIGPTNCVCTPSAGNCGSISGIGGLCGSDQREWDFNCNPQGCNGAAGDSYCVNDLSCCNTYSPQGCGTFPCPATGCSGASTTPPATNNCYFGQVIMATQCSSLPVQCNPDPLCPLPACLGILSPGALYCATQTTTPPSGLSQNYPENYMSGGVAGCPANAICQLYCDASRGYFINPSGTSCLEQFTVAACADNTGHGCAPCAGPCSTYQNNQSFTMCAGPKAVITSVAISDISNPISPPGCGSSGYPTPGYTGPGRPGESCRITFSF